MATKKRKRKLVRRPKVPPKKRKVVRKKPVTKKRKVVRRKPVAKKRKVVRKKPVVRRKPVTKKRKVVRKKPVAKKRKVVRKKPVAKKRVVRKKPVAKKRVVRRKPVAKKRKVVRKKTTPLERARRRLRELVDGAKRRKRIRRRPRLPNRMRRTVRIDEGEQRRVTVERVITPSNVSEIVYRVEGVVSGMSGAYPLWLATLEISTLGDKLIGYGQHAIEVPNDDEEDEEETIQFTVSAFDSTGVFGSSEGMMGALEAKLDDYSSERRAVVFLHSVKVMNFRRRT